MTEKGSNKIGLGFLPSLVSNTLLWFCPYLIPLALMILPLYIVGYDQLTLQYKLTILLSFLLIGGAANYILVIQNKKDAIYQGAWSLYVGSIFGFIALFRASGNHADNSVFILPGIFYGSYLLVVFTLNHWFHLNFQFFAKNASRPSRTISFRDGTWLVLLIPAGLFFFGWLLVFKIIPLGFRICGLLIPPDSFVFVFPDKEMSQFIWPLFYVLGSFLAAVPVILVLINLVELTVRLTTCVFNPEKRKSVHHEFKNKTGGLVSLVRWMTLPLIPFMLYGLMRFYYLDTTGVHLYHWPMKTEDFPWKSVRWIRMKAWGTGELQYGYHMNYELMLPNGQYLKVSWEFFEGTTDHQVAESYLKISRIIKDIPLISVKTDVSPGGMVFLKQELGDGAKDVLLRP